MNSDDTPTAMVYDIFAETANQLSSRYVQLSRDAQDEAGRAYWWAKVMELRDTKLAVDAYDRTALLSWTATWADEIRRLKAEQRG